MKIYYYYFEKKKIFYMYIYVVRFASDDACLHDMEVFWAALLGQPSSDVRQLSADANRTFDYL